MDAPSLSGEASSYYGDSSSTGHQGLGYDNNSSQQFAPPSFAPPQPQMGFPEAGNSGYQPQYAPPSNVPAFQSEQKSVML